jgi:SAM-dependent methyltransferase
MPRPSQKQQSFAVIRVGDQLLRVLVFRRGGATTRSMRLPRDRRACLACLLSLLRLSFQAGTAIVHRHFRKPAGTIVVWGVVTVPSNSRDFWSEYQPGLKWLEDASRGPLTREGYEAIRSSRYRRESHLETVAGFDDHPGELVVDVGCGVGIDGSRFLEGGARYVGVDQSEVAVRTTRRSLDLLGLKGVVVQGDATALPIASATADFVYSNGVLHHFPDTAAAVREIHRVLRPGGQCLVMLYHRPSFNYNFNIMVVRRLGAPLLFLPGGARLVARLTGESEETLAGHRALLRRHGLAYLTDRQLFLSNNTDGPGNPLSKAYSRSQARDLFAQFAKVETEVHYLNLRTLPLLDRLLAPATKERLARRLGWHLYVRATRS